MKEEGIKELFKKYSTQFFEEYGIIVVALVVGIILGWYIKLWLADKKFIGQLKVRIQEKDLRIAELNCIVHDRLSKVVVDEQNKSFFKRVRKYFKKQFKIKK